MLQLLVYLLAILGATISQSNDGLMELNLIHFNDFHAHFDEINTQGSVCQPEQEVCIGGYSRLYSAIKQIREVEPESIVLNGGDTFQGTAWYNFMRWNASVYFMNLLPHDVHVLGNHEFDHGVEGLVPYLERLNTPMLGANVNTTFEPTMTPYIKNHIIVERHGRKIGIIGILLQSFSAPIGGVIMEDEAEAANREAAILTAQGVDIIILLTHVGYDRDMALAQQVSSDIDIIVGAHSHSLLYTGESPSGETPWGDYPTVIEQANGHKIPIVQASCYTRYLGNIKLFIDDQGIVQRWEGQPIYLGSSIIPDPEIDAILEPWRAEVNALTQEVLSTSLVTLNRGWCYRQECNMGSWACDGFLEEMMENASGNNWNDVHVCMINAGGLRVQINPGELTTDSLLRALPFENTVQVYDLKGEYLLEALEFSVGTFQSTPGDFYSGRMLQIGGMRNTYNASMPVGSRVTATVRCIECDIPVYLPLDPQKTYRVLTQNYIGDGGGGYTMLSENRENLVELDVDYVMLQRYLRPKEFTWKDLDGRIKIVW